MHLSRRRKKRPNNGIRTVEVIRGPNGFGFTISGQQPCILSCIVANSPADNAGLRAGDFLISVNGVSVSKVAHDAIANLIGSCVGPIRMTIAENYFSDSSEEEMEVNRMVVSRKPKYPHKSRNHRISKQLQRNEYCDNISNSFALSMEDEMGPIEYKALVGYLGTIEMPKQLMPNSRFQTVCSCIKKLRQEKRIPTAVLMTIFPTCLTLKNSSNHILAIYPTNRVVYIGSTAEKDSRYFGLVTSVVNDSGGDGRFNKAYLYEEKKNNHTENETEISNSCHVFMIDTKIIEHSVHAKKANTFKFICTSDRITGNCLEFPKNALYIVNLVQSMYKLENDKSGTFEDLNPVVANSPQPSASSNSDSGIGFKDDCGNISDRILVVEFPAHPLSVVSPNDNRSFRIDECNASLTSPNLHLNNDHIENELYNAKSRSLDIALPNNLSKCENNEQNVNLKQFNNLNNIRACGTVNIRNVLEKNENFLLVKQNNSEVSDRLTCRAMPDKPARTPTRTLDNIPKMTEQDNTQSSVENSMYASQNAHKISFETLPLSENMECKNCVDNLSAEDTVHPVFRTPDLEFFESKKLKRHCKVVSSCDSLDKFDESANYKLAKANGLSSKPNYSCEELNTLDSFEKHNFGSLQDLCTLNEQRQIFKNMAQSEPDVRIKRFTVDEKAKCDQIFFEKSGTSEGPTRWAASFEKLLEDPLGLHTFAEFLKKEFSAENIYFWAACERFRRLPAGPEKVAEAQRIYQQHLCVGAPESVNVDSQGRHCTEQQLLQASDTLFDQAQKQIFNLMKFDSYPRFLKSDIYKLSVSGEAKKPQPDSGLELQPHPVVAIGNHMKLKKSLSNAEDRRRKSLLPWHRKNRSKSKDRGEAEYTEKRSDINASNESVNKKMGGGSSSKSSLTSLDLAVGSIQDVDKICKEGTNSSAVVRNPLCRVLLSNGTTTVVQIKPDETIQELVGRLLDKRRLVYSAFEVYTDKHPKAMDIREPSTKLAGCEVTVEQRVVFKIDLPNKKVISVKSKSTKVIADVLRPILFKYMYNLDKAKVTFDETEPVDISSTVTSIDGKRLRVHYATSTSPMRLKNEKTKLDELTNQVFEDILQDKAASGFLKPKSDKGSIKSEDWGSEHSSGIFGRFLRRDSGVQARKKKQMILKGKTQEGSNFVENTTEQVKKPLIAKWKTGVNKLQVTCNDNDELVEGLTRAQRCRLEDQRGTEINFELPDFLKDKDNIEEKIPKMLEPNSKRYSGDKISPGISNYENRSIISRNFDIVMNNSFSPYNQKPLHSLNKLTSEESIKTTQSTLPKCNTENATKENKQENLRCVQPPPLPPKPKTFPIRPSNWGQNSIYKSKQLIEKNSLYLEQPTSSFV